MSNNPLLGLDFQAPEPEKTKWVEIPKKRRGGYATRLRASRYERDEDGDVYTPVPPTPALPVIAPEIKDYLHDNLGMSPPAPPKAYALKKPSLIQRFLDWLLL